MNQNRGYTLLEILFSLIVIATLTLVFVGVMQKIQQKNQIKTTALQMNAITNAATTYYQMYQAWPTAITTLNTLLNTNISCSIWKNSSNTCVPYQITSTATSRYFTVAVTTPSTTIASRLTAALPTAYQNGTTVTAYTTSFAGLPKPPIPPGVLLTATSAQLNGICSTGTTGGTMPFSTCVSSTSPTPTPYGLLDLANQPLNTVVSQNVAANISALAPASISATQAPICPSGYLKTVVFFFAGVRTSVAYTATDGPTTGGTRFDAGSGFVPQGFMGFTGLATNKKNTAAGAFDIICVPSTGIGNNWRAV